MKTISLQSFPGSLVGAAAIHAMLYGAIILLLGTSLFSAAPEQMVDATVDYEVLDAPPAPAQKEAHVVKAQPDAPAPQPKMETASRELQDEKSDVVGTSQASIAKPSVVGSENGGDANATPFYKIKPKYPKPALISGTEGWILMKIDVNEQGGVENVRVIGGEMRNLFQDEARRAVEQWKYRPFLDRDGKPLRKADHQVRVDFKLSDAKS